MAELVSCLSIIPHMRSFDVPLKLSPAHAGLFFAPRIRRALRLFLLPPALDRLRDLLVMLRQVRAVPAPGQRSAAFIRWMSLCRSSTIALIASGSGCDVLPS